MNQPWIKLWNASQICVSSLRRGHANLLCIVPILVLLKRALEVISNVHILWLGKEATDYYFHFLIRNLVTDRIKLFKV